MGAISLGPLLGAQLVIDDKAAKHTKEETQQNKQVAQINNYSNNYKLKYSSNYKYNNNYKWMYNYNNNLVTMFNLLVCRSGRTSGIHASTMRWQTRRNNSFNMDDLVIICPVIIIVAAVVVEGLLTCSLVVLSISNCLSSKRALQNCRLLLFCTDDDSAAVTWLHTRLGGGAVAAALALTD